MSGLYLPTVWVVPSGTLTTDPNVFPFLRGQKFLALKGPSWDTIVKQAASRRQVRCSLQAAPVWKFKVRYGVIEDQPLAVDLQWLWAFFNTRNGQQGEFFYNDPADNTVSDVQVGVGDGVTTTYQLQRIGGVGTPSAFMEPVRGLNGAPIVSVAGAPTTAFTVNPYGTITFNTAPAEGAAISWSGQFFFLCHFTDDDLTPQQLYQSLWSLDGLEFESLV